MIYIVQGHIYINKQYLLTMSTWLVHVVISVVALFPRGTHTGAFIRVLYETHIPARL